MDSCWWGWDAEFAGHDGFRGGIAVGIAVGIGGGIAVRIGGGIAAHDGTLIAGFIRG